MKRNIVLFTLAAALLMISGCSTTGAFRSGSLTEVQLAEGNYRIVATNVEGKSSAGYLLGISSGMYGGQMQSLALIRVSGSGMIYSEAIKNLWSNFSTEYGEVQDRKLALVNVRYDTDALNLIIYTQANVSVRADVIEFDD